jgi:nucleoside-diphosphate-sugar epimerase
LLDKLLGAAIISSKRLINISASRELPGGIAMRVALTGATGFIGSHVLAELQEHGHEVTALVRDDAQADVVSARGAAATVVDLYDRPALVSVLSAADGAIHTASPGDATSADLDSAVVDAAVEALAGTGKPYLHISGAWVYGDNTAISEESPFNSPALVAWREQIERRLLDATDMRGVVIVSGVAYGDGGGGIPGLLLGSPRDDAGNLIMVGTGRQHWPTVHVADLADFFRRALEAESARGYYVLGDGVNSTVAELTEAAATARFQAPMTRLGHGWATTSPRSCCSIRPLTQPRLEPRSAGLRPVRGLSTSSATGATASKRRTLDQRDYIVLIGRDRVRRHNLI